MTRFFALVLFVVGSLAYCGSEAHTFNEGQCIQLSQKALDYTLGKLQGVEYAPRREALVKTLALAKGAENSWIEDDRDVALVLAIFDAVYKSEHLPGANYDTVLVACMNAKPPALPDPEKKAELF